jgi:hypothetical protein
MSNLPKSNPELDAAINGVTDVTALRETLLRTLTAQGTLVRSRDDEFNNRLIRKPEAETPEVALPANPARDTCVRVVYPSGNNRVELYGRSEQELDEQEAKIRQALGGGR